MPIGNVLPIQQSSKIAVSMGISAPMQQSKNGGPYAENKNTRDRRLRDQSVLAVGNHATWRGTLTIKSKTLYCNDQSGKQNGRKKKFIYMEQALKL